MRRLCLLLAIAVVTATGASAQRLALTSYTTSDGLADNQIARIVRDTRGFLWFCTAQGLSRFDGYAFTTFGTEQGLPAAQVNDLLETRRGEYFVATDGGLVRFDPRGAPMFSTVPWADARQRGHAVTVLREGRDGTVWAGADEGLFRLDRTSYPASLRSVEIGLPRTHPGGSQILAVTEDRLGSIWAGGSEGLYRRWPDGTFARYKAGDLPGEFVQTIYESREGHLWIGTRASGFFSLSTDATHKAPAVGLHFTLPEIRTTGVWQVFETSDNRFWVATGDGLVVFSSEAATSSRRFQILDTREGLPDRRLSAAAEDIAGNLWLGTGNYGATRLAAGGLTTYGERDGIREINQLFEDRTGRLCFRGLVVGNYAANRSVFEGEHIPLVGVEQPGTVVRVGCFDGQEFHAFFPAVIRGLDWLDGWKREHVTLQTRRGDWWLASGNGVYHFPAADSLDSLRSARPLEMYTIGHGLAARQGFNLFEDSRGLIWISTIGYTDHGLARWNPADGHMQDLAGSPGLPNVATRLALSFADRAGSVWIGFNGAVARYRDGGFVTFDAADGVPPGRIWEMYVDHAGTLWLASLESGLIRVEAADADHPHFKAFTMRDGLSTNSVQVVVEDLAGNVYMGGSHGIDRLNPATGEVRHYTKDDGAAPGLLRSAFRDRHGVLWFGTDFGLTRLDPSTLPQASTTGPGVFITGVSVGGVRRTVSTIGERTIELSDLSPSEKEVSIEFSALRFFPGESPRYQVRLSGADSDWGAAKTDRSVTYANLGPGRYTFLVRAIGANGAMSAEPASVSFTILAPVWRRWWFIALVVVAAGLLARVVYQRRVVRLLELANMRTRIASDLHDDIGANLTRIALLSDAVQGGNGHEASIGRIARESVGAMADIVWAIKPEREGLIDLSRRMRQQADDLFVPRDINLRFSAPPAELALKLPVDLRRDVLLFFKEAVTNVARHSQCTSVTIELAVEGSRLTLVVSDNGRGFDVDAEHQGQGLRSLRRRAARLGAAVTIASEAGRGTTISLSVPL